MGAAASITQEEAASYPQYEMLGGSTKFAELKDADGKVALDMVQDPYLLYGGAYDNDPKDTIGFKYVNFSKMPTFTSEHISALANTLTPNLFEKLKDLATSKGFTFSNTIQPGVITPCLEVGVAAGDEESYETFKELFYPIIKMVHGFDPIESKHRNNLDSQDLELSSEQLNLFNQYVSSFSLQGERNIAGISFSAGAKSEDRESVEQLMNEFANSMNGKYYSLNGLSDQDIALLTQKGVYMKMPSPGEFITSSGGARSWPKNRGVFLNESDDSYVWINYEDHIRFGSKDSGSNIATVWTKFCELNNSLKAYLESKGKTFARVDNLGYIGSNIVSSIGNAMTASVIVSVSKFQKSVDLLKEVTTSNNLDFKIVSDSQVMIKSKAYLGKNEWQVMKSFIDSVCTLLKLEADLSSGTTPEAIREQLNVSNAVPEEKPASTNVTSPKSSSMSKVVVVASSPRKNNVVSTPKQVVVAPTSPKLVDTSQKVKTPKSARVVEGIPPKSPAKSPAKNVESNNQPSNKVGSSKPISAGFMSSKFNNKLTIEIDELKFPGDH